MSLSRFNLFPIAITLGIISAFQRDIIRVIRKNSLQNLTENIIFAFFIAAFLLIFIRFPAKEKRNSAAVLIFILGTLAYFYFTGPLLLLKFQLIEFFIVGIIISPFFLRSGTFIPVLFIVFLAIFVNVIDNVVTGNDIFLLGILRNSITGIGGFIAGLYFFGRK